MQSVYERLEGWWFNNVVHHLANDGGTSITRYEVQEKLADIADQFRAENLPIDFLDTVLTGVHPVSVPNVYEIVPLNWRYTAGIARRSACRDVSSAAHSSLT